MRSSPIRCKASPLKTTFVVASGGTGQMLSLPMNEAIQEMFKEVYIDVEFKVVERGDVHGVARRRGGRHEQGHHRQQHRLRDLGPGLRITRFFASNQAAPVGVNWSYYKNDEVDKLIGEALNTFDASKQDAIMAKVHEKVVDEAALIWVVHDTNVQAQH